jgi:large subunit ribosomal protein L21
MDKYAVVRVGGKQYKVSEGDELVTDKVLDTKGLVPEVLLYADNEKIKVGKPVLTDVKVKFKVLTDLEKGKKIEIYKFKAKARYRKHTGFRPQHTRFLVEKIG